MRVWFVVHKGCNAAVKYVELTDRFGLTMRYVDSHLYFYVGDTGIADLDEVPDGMEVLGCESGSS